MARMESTLPASAQMPAPVSSSRRRTSPAGCTAATMGLPPPR